MGFSGGASLVKPFFNSGKLSAILSSLKHGHVLIDASGLIHAAMSIHARGIIAGDWVPFDRDVTARLNTWQYAKEDVIPVFVIDGHRCGAKRANLDRQKERDEAMESIEAIRVQMAGLKRDFLACIEEEKKEAASAASSSSTVAQAIDLASQRQTLTQQACEADKKLRSCERRAVGAHAPEAAYRMLQMCASRKIATIVAAGEAEHTMAAYFALSQAEGAFDYDVAAVCGYDTDFFVLGCPIVLYGQGLQGVLARLEWSKIGAELIKKSDYLLGQLGKADSDAILTAMHKYGAKLVVQLTALFSDNDYVAYPGVGPAKLAATWKLLLGSDELPTLRTFAAQLATFQWKTKATQWLRNADAVDELTRRAERAAFMYFGQPVIVGEKLYFPPLPAFVAGCCARLFAEVPPTGHFAPGRRLLYKMQRAEDKDVTQLAEFVTQFSKADLVRWANGEWDVRSLDPAQLLPAPEPTISAIYQARRALDPAALVRHLSIGDCRRLAGRLSMACSTLSDADVRVLLESALQLHYDHITPGGAATALVDVNKPQVEMVNKAKRDASDALRKELREGTVVDFRDDTNLEMRHHFECPLEVFNTWEMMLDDIPCVQNGRREVVSRYRMVSLDKVVVDKKDCNRGFVQGRVATSTRLDTFYTVVAEVRLETSIAAAQAGEECKHRRIKAIDRVTCLLANNLVDADGSVLRNASGNVKASVKSARLCFGGEYCIHVAAFVRNMHLATASSTTERACYWKQRVISELSAKFDAATEAPFCQVMFGVVGEPEEGTSLSLESFNPVREEYRADIAKGIGPRGDIKYRAGYLAYRELKLKATGAKALRTDVITHPCGVEDWSLDAVDVTITHGSGALPPDGVVEQMAGGDGDGMTLTSIDSSDVAVVAPPLMPAADSVSLAPPVTDATADDAGGPATPGSTPAVPQSTAESASDGNGAATSEGFQEMIDEPPAKRVPGRRGDYRDLRGACVTRRRKGPIGRRRHHQCECRQPGCLVPDDDTPCGDVPPRRKIKVPSDVSKRAMLRRTLFALGLTEDEVVKTLTRKKLFISAGHYSEDAFWRTDRGWQIAAPATELPCRVVATELDQQKLALADEKFKGYIDNCVCADSTCTRELDGNNSVALKRGSSGRVDDAEFKALRSSQSSIENTRLRNFTALRRVRVDARHFEDSQLVVRNGVLKRAKGSHGCLAKPTQPAARTTPEERVTLQTGRQAVCDAGGRIDDFGVDELTRLGANFRALQDSVAEVSDALAALQVASDKTSDVTTQQFKQRAADTRQHLMKTVEAFPAQCKGWTDEPDAACLRAKFDYLNAHGALDDLVYWHHGATRRNRLSNAGRKRALSSYEAYVLFKMRLRLGTSSASFIAHSFGVSEHTLSRTYHTFLRAVTFIMGKHQPWPTSAAMLHNVDDLTRELLGLAEDTIVTYGDATERKISRPSLLGSALHSDYKATNTLKYNAIAIDGGYLCEITPGFSGRTSDNKLHMVDSIPQRIAHACGDTRVTYIYDKGLNAIRCFAEAGVLLVRPYAKERGQVATSAEDAHLNRVIASRRVIIENCFADVRDSAAFGDVLRISSIAQMDLEANMARVEANTRARRGSAAEEWKKAAAAAQAEQG